MLSSYLLQASHHNSLQVQNSSGTWIPCPPIPGTFVVALGQGLEAITGGVVTSTTHRVLSPEAGEGPRYSIPFFQGISYDAEFCQMDVPEEVRELKRQVLARAKEEKGEGGNEKEVEMTFRKDLFGRLGEATLWNRVKVSFWFFFCFFLLKFPRNGGFSGVFFFRMAPADFGTQSHTDVGERFYPDILSQIRAQHSVNPSAPASALASPPPTSSSSLSPPSTDSSQPQPQGRRRAPTIILDRVDDVPAFGEDPGPDGSFERKEAWEKRKMDSTPDEVRVGEKKERDGYV